MKRLIEMDFPIAEVSRESAREKSIRHGHISTLHIWWARRPLAACRAAIFASLVPTPAGMVERIDEYVRFLLKTLPKAPDEEDHEWDGLKAHRRLVKFTADLAPWEVTQNKRLLDKARKIILVGKAVIDGLRGKELQEVIDGKREVAPPKVLDPFAGGGAIPLEALRLGCETYAMDYNPVAVLILKASLEYPQKYGKKLVDDVRKWGNWVLEEVRKEVGRFYPEEGEPAQQSLSVGGKSGAWAPFAYVWAKTIPCQNPSCGAEVPLMRQFWLRRRERDGKPDWSSAVYLRPTVDRSRKRVNFVVAEGRPDDGFDPGGGTRPGSRTRGAFACPVCGTTYTSAEIQRRAQSEGLGQRLVCVGLQNRDGHGKRYRVATRDDLRACDGAVATLHELVGRWKGEMSLVPDEPMPPIGTYGIDGQRYTRHQTWGELFTPRQALALCTFVQKVREARERIAGQAGDPELAAAVSISLGLVLDRIAECNTTLCHWEPVAQCARGLFARQAIPMVWDFGECVPTSRSAGSWHVHLERLLSSLDACYVGGPAAYVSWGTATRLEYPVGFCDTVITDPPYYDSVPYADLSDFYYVWLKRSIGDGNPTLFATPLTPKQDEIIQEPMRHDKDRHKAKRFYEGRMGKAFEQMAKVLGPQGTAAVVFAHKTTEAWETLVTALLQSGLVPTSSWPIRTEMGSRLRARESAALASSFFLACRKREGEREAFLKDIRQDLQKRIHERLDHFWEQGIRGADFFISAIGPAVEVFGQYAKVKKVSGEEVTVSELLGEVRREVTEYALKQILKGVRLEKIDPVTRFYILWRWTFNGETVEYDEGNKLAQAVGVELDDIRGMDKLVEGKDKISVAKPQDRELDSIPGKGQVSMVNALHRACLLWDADKTKELQEFLADVGYADDPCFWETAQALSELIPDGDKEKQMLQGLLMKAPAVAAEVARQLTLRGFDK